MSEAREAAWEKHATHWMIDPQKKSEHRDDFRSGWDAAKADSANPAESPESLSISNPANPKAEPVTIDLTSVIIRAIADTGQLDPDDETTQQIASLIADAVRAALAAQPVTGTTAEVEWGTRGRYGAVTEASEEDARRAVMHLGHMGQQGIVLVTRTPAGPWVEVPN